MRSAPHTYKQTCGVVVGTSPAPDLANNFTFLHELKFLSYILNEYKQCGPSPYPFKITNHFAASTKRHINSIFYRMFLIPYDTLTVYIWYDLLPLRSFETNKGLACIP